jgi:NADP-dependent aldehyde dehydrogenase
VESIRTFRTFCPERNTKNEIVIECSSSQEIEEALNSAHLSRHFWENKSIQLRVDFLLAIRGQLIQDQSEIQYFYCLESGLSVSRFEVEFTRTLFQLEHFANFLQTNFSRITAQTEKQDYNFPTLYKHLCPIGPVVVLGSSNFPLAYSTIGGDSVAAIAAGCPVIVKAHPFHALTSIKVASAVKKVAEKLELPNGVFTHLLDDGYSLATQLVTDERVKGVGFTGSIQGGRAIFDLANRRLSPIPVFAEMGSSNPVVINFTEWKESKKYAELLAHSITNDAGQFCTKPGLIFLPNSNGGSEFIEQLIHQISNCSNFFMLHPSILANFEKNKEIKLQTDKVQLVVEKSSELSMQGNITLATCDARTFLNHENLQEEVFGPFALIIRYEDDLELEKCLSKLHGQLTGTILTDLKSDQIKSKDWFQMLKDKVGRLILNGVPTGVSVHLAMNHGGPYPATTDSRFTAVGASSIYRFLKNITFQNW